MSELAVTLKTDINNPDPGDLYLDLGGHEVVRTALADEVAQRLTVRFSFWLGEWFLNLDEGTPWVDRILVKAPTDLVIRTVLGNIVRSTEGVAELTKLTYSISRARVMSVSIEAQLEDGTTFTTRDYAPFVLDLSNVT